MYLPLAMSIADDHVPVAPKSVNEMPNFEKMVNVFGSNVPVAPVAPVDPVRPGLPVAPVGPYEPFIISYHVLCIVTPFAV